MVAHKFKAPLNQVPAFRADWGPDDADLILCQVCLKQFPSVAATQQHLRTCIKTGWELKVMMQRLTDDELLALEKPSSDDSPSHECHLCGEHNFTAENLQQHVDLHSTLIPGLIQCAFNNKCARIFYSSEQLKEHREEHSKGLRIVCEVCNAIYEDKFLFEEHTRKHKREASFACDIPGCSYAVKLPEYEEMHKKHEHNSILFTCLMCGKNFSDSVGYKIHLVQHHDGVFTCAHKSCKLVFQNGDDLSKHTKEAHEDFKPLLCKICMTLCTSESDLQLHKINAHSIWPHKCGLCGKGYISLKLCKQHVVAHEADTGVFKCLHGACLETFSLPSDLMTHVKQHWKTFSCDIPECLFSSNVKLSLQYHKSSVHSIWLYNCQLCDRGFDRSNDLKQHEQSHEEAVPSAFQCNFKECKQTFTLATDLKKHTVEHWYPQHAKRQLGDEDSNLTGQQISNVAEEQLLLTCKDEIEEVVFD
jgi:KRAB domain-containing zinc finger protein